MQDNEVRQIRKEKAKLNHQLQHHEGTLLRVCDELYALKNHEPPAVPDMSADQAKAAFACMIGAKNVQIAGSQKQINETRMQMAKLTIKEIRLMRGIRDD